MKKRIFSLLVVCCLVLSVLSACSNNQQTETSGSDSATTGTLSETKKFDDVTVTFLRCWNGGVTTPEDLIDNDVAKAIRDKIVVTVIWEGIMMDHVEKLNMMFAANDMPDAVAAPFWGSSDTSTQVIKKAALEGMFHDINGVVDKYDELKGAWDPGILTESYLNNDVIPPEANGAKYTIVYGAPANEDNIINWAYGVFARGDIVDAIGIDPKSIKTSNDLYAFLEKVRDGNFTDINGNPIIPATTSAGGWDLSGYTQNFGDGSMLGSFYREDDGSFQYGMLGPTWVDSNMFLWKLLNNNILDKECFTQSHETANQKIAVGKAAVISCQFGAMIEQQQKSGLLKTNPEMEYVAIGPLDYSTGESAFVGTTYGVDGSGVIFFPKSSKNL